MAGRHEGGVERRNAETMELTLDEAAVIRMIRETPWGEVFAETKRGAIVNYGRRETRRPPSLVAREVSEN